MFQKSWKGIFNISKNTQNQPKNGHAGTVRKLKSSQNMLFFLVTDCIHKRTKFWMFHNNWQDIFIISKNTQNQPKNGHAGKVRIPRFCRKLKSSQNMLFFLETDCLHEGTKFCMFHNNWKGIFNISKNTQNQQKNGHAGKVRIQRFWSNLKNPQNMPFFLRTDCFHERTKFWMFHKNWKGIFNISKNTQNQQKMAKPVRSGYSDFAKNLKVPKTCFFFLKLTVFIKEQNFECFTTIGRIFSSFQKILKINQKMATPVKSGYRDFVENWKVPKTCFFFLKLIVFMKEQNFECFTRIGRAFLTFQKILKINKKWPSRYGPDTAILPKIEKFPKHAFFSWNWLYS